jgi:hypothetical protein
MRRPPVVVALIASVVLALGAASWAGTTKQASIKDFDPAKFSDGARIDNEFLPMPPGTQLVFEGKANRGEGRKVHQVIFTVTDLTKVIDGVRSNVIWDQDVNDGELQESEIAFNAQDDDGNVWLMGEFPAEYEDGAFKRAPDTWIAGLDKARPGILMRAEPRTRTPAYIQGLAPAIEFDDRAKVAKTGGRTCVPADCYDNVLLIREWNPHEPEEGFQLKYYAPGVGNIQVGAQGGKEKEVLVLTEMRQLDEAGLAEARAASLELEAHAYERSKVYQRTTPLELCTPDGQCAPAAGSGESAG